MTMNDTKNFVFLHRYWNVRIVFGIVSNGNQSASKNLKKIGIGYKNEFE